jgi:hypothetical protein
VAYSDDTYLDRVAYLLHQDLHDAYDHTYHHVEEIPMVPYHASYYEVHQREAFDSEAVHHHDDLHYLFHHRKNWEDLLLHYRLLRIHPSFLVEIPLLLHRAYGGTYHDEVHHHIPYDDDLRTYRGDHRRVVGNDLASYLFVGQGILRKEIRHTWVLRGAW